MEHLTIFEIFTCGLCVGASVIGLVKYYKEFWMNTKNI